MDVNDKNLYHFKTRSFGELYQQPLQAGKDVSAVTRKTYQEMAFPNSMESERFMRSVQPRYANNNQLSSMKKLKFVSKNDEF